jgi:hypothetical protein
MNDTWMFLTYLVLATITVAMLFINFWVTLLFTSWLLIVVFIKLQPILQDSSREKVLGKFFENAKNLFNNTSANVIFQKKIAQFLLLLTS